MIVKRFLTQRQAETRRLVHQYAEVFIQVLCRVGIRIVKGHDNRHASVHQGRFISPESLTHFGQFPREISVAEQCMPQFTPS